jgi:hypothetical protein
MSNLFNRTIIYLTIFGLVINLSWPIFALAIDKSAYGTVKINDGGGPAPYDPTDGLTQFANSFSADALIREKLNIDGFDKEKLDEYAKVAEYVQKHPGVSYDKAITDSGVKKLQTYDIRLIRSIDYLVNSLGADEEWLKIDTIAKGYTGNNNKYEQDYNFKPDEAVTISPHYTGQAAKISQKDYLRYVSITRDENGQIVDKKKIKKQPIELSWQESNPSTNQNPPMLNQNPLSLFNGLLGASINNWLSSVTGEDYTQMNIDGRALPQIIKQMGAFNINKEYNLPVDNDIAFSASDLKSFGNETGSTILEESFNQKISKYGFSGSNLLDWQMNIGRSTIESRMGLASGSLKSDISQGIISLVGERKIEDSLKLTEGTLTDLKNKEDLEEKVGNGYLYKINIDYKNFDGDNYEKTRAKNDTEKFDAIFADPNLVDGLLSVPYGTTAKYKNNESNTKEYKKEIGKALLDQKVYFYQNNENCTSAGCVTSNSRDEVFDVGEYNPTPGSNQKSLIDRFLDGDNNAFKDIGLDAIAKVFANEKETRDVIKNWLNNKTIDKDENGVEKINLEAIAGKFGLRKNDLWAIFANDNSKEVFQRVGQTELISNLEEKDQAEINSYLPALESDDFYNTRLDNIKNAATTLSKTSSLNTLASEIVNLALDAKNAKDSTAPDAIANYRYNKIMDNSYEISIRISKIDKQTDKKDDIKTIRQNLNEIIESRSLKKLSDYDTNSIPGIKSNIGVGLTLESVINVLKDKDSIDSLKLKVGLETWSTKIFNKDLTNTLSNALTEIENNKTQKPSEIIFSKLGSDTLEETAKEFNSSFELDGSYKITATDLALFVNGDFKILMKIGNSILDKSMSMADNASYDIITNKSSWQNETGKTGVNQIWNMFGLAGGPANYDSNILNQLSQNYLEQNLGLLKNSFSGSLNDVIGKNGLERTLNAFGINIPSSITSIKFTDPLLFDINLKNFFDGQIKIGDSDFWKNLGNMDMINSVLSQSGFSNLGINDIKNILTGNGNIGSMLDKIGNSDFFKNTLGSDNLNSIFNLNGTVGNLENVFNDLKNNPANAINTLSQLTNTNIVGQFGIDITKIFTDPANQGKVIQDLGMQIMSKNFGVDPALVGTAGDLIGQFFKNGQKTPDILNSLGTLVQNYTGIPYIDDALKFFKGDASGGLLAMGASEMQQQLSSMGITGISYDDIRKAYFDIKPGSDSWNKAWDSAYAQAHAIPGWNDFDFGTKATMLDAFHEQALNKIKTDAAKNIEYGLMDGGLNQLIPGGGSFVGFSRMMLEGSVDDKIKASAMLLGNVVGGSEVGKWIADIKVAEDLAKFLKDPKNNKMPSEALGYLDSVFGKWLGDVPSGFSNALMGAISGDMTMFKQMGESFMVSKLCGFMDKALGSEATGIAFMAYSMYQSYQTAVNALGSAISTFDPSKIAAASLQLNMLTAGMVATVANMVLGQTLANFDQSLGLPAGTSSLILTGVIYGLMVPGITAGALLGMMAMPIAGLILGPLLGGGLLGGILGGAAGGTTEIHITGCGYWPEFEEKNTGPDGKCPEELVLMGGMDEKLLKPYLKKVAEYKIQLLLKNLLEMPNEDKIGQFLTYDERREMLPTQIRTYDPEDIVKNSILAEKQYDTYDNTGGSILWLLMKTDSIRKGIGWSKYFMKDLGFSY